MPGYELRWDVHSVAFWTYVTLAAFHNLRLLHCRSRQLEADLLEVPSAFSTLLAFTRYPVTVTTASTPCEHRDLLI